MRCVSPVNRSLAEGRRTPDKQGNKTLIITWRYFLQFGSLDSALGRSAVQQSELSKPT